MTDYTIVVPTAVRGDGATYSGNELFLDTFNYDVAPRSASIGEADSPTLFASSGGWNGYNDIRTDNPGVNLSGYSFADMPNASQTGFMSTATSIPGYSGRIPGESGRMLFIEGLCKSLDDAGNTSITRQNEGAENEWIQTNIYLNLALDIPADVWYQYWIFINNDVSQYSRIKDSKWQYHYDLGGAPNSNEDGYTILGIFGNQSYEPNPSYMNDNIGCYIKNTSVRNASYSAHSSNPDDLGPNLVDAYVPFGQWVLVKEHYDQSGTNGEWHQWLRDMDDVWVKTAEWIGGTTDNFTWVLDARNRAGESNVRWPTTLNYTPNGTALPNRGTDRNGGDAFIYVADYCIAENESDLPTYGY